MKRYWRFSELLHAIPPCCNFHWNVRVQEVQIVRWTTADLVPSLFPGEILKWPPFRPPLFLLRLLCVKDMGFYEQSTSRKDFSFAGIGVAGTLVKANLCLQDLICRSLGLQQITVLPAFCSLRTHTGLILFLSCYILVFIVAGMVVLKRRPFI